MTKFEVFKLVHIIAAMTWVGGATLAVIEASRMKNAEPAHRIGFARDMRFVAQWVFLPAAVLVYIFGSLMIEEVRPAYDYDQAWVIIGTLGILVTVIIAAALLVPWIRKAVKLMEAGDGAAAAPVMARIGMFARLNVLLLFVVVWAMVVRPGA